MILQHIALGKLRSSFILISQSVQLYFSIRLNMIKACVQFKALFGSIADHIVPIGKT